MLLVTGWTGYAVFVIYLLQMIVVLIVANTYDTAPCISEFDEPIALWLPYKT